MMRAIPGVGVVLTALFGFGERAASAADAGPDASGRPWQFSVQGRWFPGLGEAKGSVAEGGGPEAGAGYSVRLERRLSDWWSAGVGLSTAAWSVAPAGETGVLESGSFMDIVLLLRLEPLRLEIPGGPLGVYTTLSGGPTLGGDTRYASALSSADGDVFESVRLDAGYSVGATLGVSYRPAQRLSVFLEAGLDWHFAVHGRRSASFDAIAAAEPLPPVYMERLWVGQGVVGLGVAYHF